MKRWFSREDAGRGAWIAVLVLALLVLASAVGPSMARLDPDALDLANRRSSPSWHHLFGTDELGRDVLTRALYGARVSLAVGLLAAALAGALGALVGSLSGYHGGVVDAALMRAADMLLAVPRLPLLMIVCAIAQPSVAWLIVLVGAVGWMETARLVRTDVQSVRHRDYVSAARSAGAGPARIFVRHLLPALIPLLGVAVTIAVARSILLESALSFFGVGVQPPTPSWGNMLYQAQTTMATEPWLAVFPGLCIFVTALAVHLIGDDLAARREGAAA